MVTMVGLQKDFKKAVIELIELDYDAVEAYESAIKRLKNPSFKEKMQQFQSDHIRHITELSNLLKKYGEEPPQGPSGKQWLTKGKVFFAEMIGDNLILEAMISNEIDTNTAYERMQAREDIWEDAKDILNKGLQDEQHHKAWLENEIRKS